MFQAKLSSKFQLSIPKGIREDLQLAAGQKFTLVTRGSILELIPQISIQEARGMLGNSKLEKLNKSKGSNKPIESNIYRDRVERRF